VATALNKIYSTITTFQIVDATRNNGWTPLHRAIYNKHVDISQLLIDRGAKLSNVKLDNFVQAFPDWIITLVELQNNCRIAAIVIIGIHKYHRTAVTGNNDINVIKLISKHIWSTRMDDVWMTPSIEIVK
jgi:ankyrin repeat protein